MAQDHTLLRELQKYLRQVGIALQSSLHGGDAERNPAITRTIIRLFEARNDPPSPAIETRRHRRSLAEANGLLDAVSNLDEDRICGAECRSIDLAHQLLPEGRGRQHQKYISFELDSGKIDELPLPRPLVEVFVYSPRAGPFLRAAARWRGGIRWSDRREDFRTEVLGLMKAQMVKNAVIVPVGSRGGFVVKRPVRRHARSWPKSCIVTRH